MNIRLLIAMLGIASTFYKRKGGSPAKTGRIPSDQRKRYGINPLLQKKVEELPGVEQYETLRYQQVCQLFSDIKIFESLHTVFPASEKRLQELIQTALKGGSEYLEECERMPTERRNFEREQEIRAYMDEYSQQGSRAKTTRLSGDSQQRYGVPYVPPVSPTSLEYKQLMKLNHFAIEVNVAIQDILRADMGFMLFELGMETESGIPNKDEAIRKARRLINKLETIYFDNGWSYVEGQFKVPGVVFDKVVELKKSIDELRSMIGDCSGGCNIGSVENKLRETIEKLQNQSR